MEFSNKLALSPIITALPHLLLFWFILSTSPCFSLSLTIGFSTRLSLSHSLLLSLFLFHSLPFLSLSLSLPLSPVIPLLLPSSALPLSLSLSSYHSLSLFLSFSLSRYGCIML